MDLRRAAILVLSIYVLFLLDLAWLEFPSRNPEPNVVPFHSMIGDWKIGGREWIVNFLGNIVAFVPIGMIPAVARPRRAGARTAALFSLAFSAVIEAVQYATGRRTPDVDDLILNTIGGVLGYALVQPWTPGGSRPDDGAAKGPPGDGRTIPAGLRDPSRR
jgi:glycopeptide antibiotics resistance protein